MRKGDKDEPAIKTSHNSLMTIKGVLREIDGVSSPIPLSANPLQTAASAVEMGRQEAMNRSSSSSSSDGDSGSSNIIGREIEERDRGDFERNMEEVD